MITRLIPIATFFLVGCLGVPPALSQPEIQTCYFNGQEEPCTVIRLPDAYQVTWLTDGKVVLYSFFNCVGIPEQAIDRCPVAIVEQNGRLSAGVAMLGGRGPSITSDNGNSTSLPLVAPAYYEY
jgi:hypothetical protein